MGFWSGIKTCYIGLGNGIEMMNEQIESFTMTSDVLMAKMDERIIGHDVSRPLIKIKMDAHTIKCNARIARLVIPTHYKYTHESISCIAEIAKVIMEVMDATLINPKQRDFILKLIISVQAQQVMGFNHINEMMNATLEELYDRGLDRNADIGDKIKFLLECETKDENLEDVMYEVLPTVQETLKSVLASLSTLKKKGIVIN